MELLATAIAYGSQALVKVRMYVIYAPLWLSLTAALGIAGATVTSFVVTSWLAFFGSLLVAAVSFFFGFRAAIRVVEHEKLGTFR